MKTFCLRRSKQGILTFPNCCLHFLLKTALSENCCHFSACDGLPLQYTTIPSWNIYSTLTSFCKLMIDLLFINIFRAIFFRSCYFPVFTKLDFVKYFLPVLIMSVGPLQSFLLGIFVRPACPLSIYSVILYPSTSKERGKSLPDVIYSLEHQLFVSVSMAHSILHLSAEMGTSGANQCQLFWWSS